MSPVIASQSGDARGLWAMGIGLGFLGAGIGAVYAAALYYAMEAGAAAVESLEPVRCTGMGDHGAIWAA